MGKLYKTWEMIKALTENPKLKFTVKGANGAFVKSVGSEIVWDSGNRKSHLLGEHLEVDTSIEWWEITEEPVELKEAMKAHLEGKTIVCKVGNIASKYVPGFNEFKQLEDCNGLSISSKEILEGVWYIEE
jgi:hypothetical protein